MQTRYYSIQMASKLSGVGIHTIRAWEKRYNVLEPKRSDTGRRQYTDQEIEKLWNLNELTQLGHSIGNIANLDDTQLQTLLKDLKGDSITNKNSNFDQSENILNTKNALDNLILALQKYRLDIISHELKKLENSIDTKKFCFEILIPLLQEIGLLVDRKKITVSQEHALSSILKFHVGGVLFNSYLKKRNNREITIFATPEGELHEFGILISALLATQYNHHILYLGANLPADSLIQTIKAISPKLIILGAMSGYSNEHPNKYNEYLMKVHCNLNDKQNLVCGGSAQFNLKNFSGAKNFTYIKSFEEMNQFLLSFR